MQRSKGKGPGLTSGWLEAAAARVWPRDMGGGEGNRKSGCGWVLEDHHALKRHLTSDSEPKLDDPRHFAAFL